MLRVLNLCHRIARRNRGGRDPGRSALVRLLLWVISRYAMRRHVRVLL